MAVAEDGGMCPFLNKVGSNFAGLLGVTKERHRETMLNALREIKGGALFEGIRCMLGMPAAPRNAGSASECPPPGQSQKPSLNITECKQLSHCSCRTS